MAKRIRAPDTHVSTVGWYVGSHVLRFVELDRPDNDDPEARFLTWENTVLIQATNIEQAYDKVVRIGHQHAGPYKGGTAGVDVQWIFEGVSELVPVYEELQDGAEIMWAERKPTKLKHIRSLSKTKAELRR